MVSASSDAVTAATFDGAAGPVLVPSRIRAVQVYRRGAQVVRRAELTVSGAVPDEIVVAPLPLSLLDPTVRVRIVDLEADAGAVVTAASVRVGLWVKPGEPAPPPPEQQALDAAQRRRDRIAEQLHQVDLELSLLSQVPMPERPRGEEGRPPPPSPLQARLALESFTDAATRARLDEKRTLLAAQRDADEEHARLVERLQHTSSAHEIHAGSVSKSVVVGLQAQGAIRRFVVEVCYLVPGARWAPAYQVRLAKDGQSAELGLRAWVCQRSGEDWRGVRLKLATASPLRFTEVPELPSLRIGRAQEPPAARGFRPAPVGSDVLFADYDRDRHAAARASPATPPWVAPTAAPPTAPKSMPMSMPPPAPSRMAAKRRSEVAVESFDAEYDDAPADEAQAFVSETMSRAEVSAVGGARLMMASAAPSALRPSPAKERKADDGDAAGLAFAALHLAAPDDTAGRGKLRLQDVRAPFEADLRRTGRPWRFDVPGLLQRAESEAAAVQGVPIPDGATDAADVSANFDFAFEAAALLDVDGDGAFHSVSLGHKSAEAKTKYIAVPREEQAVYRQAALLNPTTGPLLSGPAEVYVGDDYILTTRLPTVPVRGELRLGLGVEPHIKVARNARFHEVRSGERVVAMTELVHELSIELVNHLPREAEIEVRERVPVAAKGAEVVVDEGPVAPDWEPYDQADRGAPIDGGRRWLCTLAPGARQELQARYVVKIYANNELVGGNRRES